MPRRGNKVCTLPFSNPISLVANATIFGSETTVTQIGFINYLAETSGFGVASQRFVVCLP